ncbi:UNVERIFIED_CONTAM: hypothetical protein Scaly_0237200 [Sesamum calycinum]|uniref:Uncharacterized protein n=1 Tax=Sesamum calycinum TaxID=2727403 RepID=A0AAW2SZN7_9LAMI
MNEEKESICYSRWVATLSQEMGKRKQRELAADHPNGVVSDTSGEHRIFRSVLIIIHPIWKSIQVAEKYQKERPQDEKVTARQRSGNTLPHLPCYTLSSLKILISLAIAIPIGSKLIILILLMICNDICIVAESRSQLDFAAHLRKPRNVRTKRAAEPSDSEVTCESSLRSCRQSRRLKCSTKFVQKWEKLDSEKFEVYMEGHWFLLIFCHFGESPQSTTKRRCMLLLDSLQKANSKQLEPGIRRFVFDILRLKSGQRRKS